ncbi:MAG: acyltransferase family protein [Lachnospiraceae bacterium]|nr:acyltransferase family protein [Lachnospiraceae bacterium]
MEKLQRERESYIDIAKGLGILLVILGHIEYMALWKVKFIYAFHMPFFFFVSGMLLFGSQTRSLKDRLIRKAKRIMLPYIFVSVADIVFHLLVYKLTGAWNFPGTLKESIVDTLCLYGYSVLWFLPALFIAEVFYFLVRKVMEPLGKEHETVSRSLPLLVTFFVAILVYELTKGSEVHVVLMLQRALLCSVFLAAGALLKPVFGYFKDKPVVSFLLGIVCFIVLSFTAQANAHIDMHTGGYGRVWLFYINALIGSFGLLFLSIGLDVLSKTEKAPFIYLGKNSLIYMIVHMDFQVLFVTEWLIIRLTHYEDLELAPWFFVPAIFLGTVLGSTVLVMCYLFVKKQVLAAFAKRKEA